MEKKHNKSNDAVIREIPYSRKNGRIRYDIPHKREPHELDFAEILIRFGLDIVFIKPSILTGISTPDCEWRGKIWEIKTIFENTDDRVCRSLKNAFAQSENVILDITKCNMTINEAISATLKYFRNPKNKHGIMNHEILIFDKKSYCVINKKVLKCM